MFATDEEKRMAALKDKYAKANMKKKVWDEVDQRWKNVEDDEKVQESAAPKVSGWGVYCHGFRRLPITSCCS